MPVNPELIKLYDEIAEMTLPMCQSCPIPISCCHKMYCEMAEATMEMRGEKAPPPTDHPTLPFMGPKGCILKPYQRPICAVHTCRINSFGFEPSKGKEWNERYHNIRGRIDELEWKEESTAKLFLLNK